MIVVDRVLLYEDLYKLSAEVKSWQSEEGQDLKIRISYTEREKKNIYRYEINLGIIETCERPK